MISRLSGAKEYTEARKDAVYDGLSMSQGVARAALSVAEIGGEAGRSVQGEQMPT
jgi:hypothetical protein